MNLLTSLYGVEYKGINGKDAIAKLLKEKQGHVKSAFFRDDIGFIDIFWGDGTAGFSHIINQRRKDKINIPQLFEELPTVIKRGTIGENANNTERENIYYKDIVVVITHELRGENVIALLTAFKTNRKV